MSNFVFDEDLDDISISEESIGDSHHSFHFNISKKENDFFNGYDVITINPAKLDEKYKSSTSDFDILKVIGKGGFGKVMLVKKICGKDKGTLYAMKVMTKASIVRSQKDTIHIRSERHILENFKHKFIVELIYAFQTDQKLYLVMEYVHGGDLYNYLERESMLSEPATRFYCAELILALEFLHINGVVYRDLKPENVLITLSGDIKLVDFGLSKESLGPKKTHTFCGTIEYMAPEVITRTGHSYSADWWSLGCLMYDMLTGSSPFLSTDHHNTIRHILKGKFLLPQYLSYEVRDLIKSLLVMIPENRISSESVYANDLKEHPFFQLIDLDELLNGKVKPPYIPILSDYEDTSFFDKDFVKMPAIDTPILNKLSPSQLDLFKGFSYVSPDVVETISGYQATSSGGSLDDAC